MTIPGGYVAGDVLTAANMNLLPGGKMISDTITGDVSISGISSAGDVGDITGLSVTWTAVASRLYRVTLSVMGTTNVAGDTLSAFITDGSNVIKQACYGQTNDATYGVGLTCFEVVSGLSGSITRKARMGMRIGTGTTVTCRAAATYPGILTVEDLGAA